MRAYVCIFGWDLSFLSTSLILGSQLFSIIYLFNFDVENSTWKCIYNNIISRCKQTKYSYLCCFWPNWFHTCLLTANIITKIQLLIFFKEKVGYFSSILPLAISIFCSLCNFHFSYSHFECHSSNASNSKSEMFIH